MANRIDVLINMVKQGHGDDQALTGLKKLSTGFENLTGVSLSAVGAFTLATKAIQYMGDAINETVDYAMTVKDFAMALGVTTEEASKLIQIGDDLRVSQETMASGFRYALDHGIVPSVEGLADLSEQMLAMEDPTQRMSFAIDTFGRAAGGEMMRVLEQGPDAIRAMSDELEGSALVMGEDAVQAADEYRLMLDEVSDSLQAAKIAMGTDLIIAVNAVSDALETTTVNTDAVKQAMDDGIISGVQAKQMYIALQNGSLEYSEALAILAQKRFEFTTAQEAAAPGDEAAISRGREGAEAAREHAGGVAELADAVNPLADALDNLATKYDAANIEAFELDATQKLLNEGIGMLTDGMIEQERVTMILAMTTEKLTGEEKAEMILALDRLAALELLNQAVDEGYISTWEYIGAMEDQQITQAEVIALLNEEEAAAFATKYGIDLLAISAQNAAGDYELNFNVSVTGDSIPSFNSSTAYTGGGGIAMASGGSFVVPPGFPNDSFVMGLTSGEQVTVLPNNYYNLTINEAGSRGNIITDFALLKSLAAV